MESPQNLVEIQMKIGLAIVTNIDCSGHFLIVFVIVSPLEELCQTKFVPVS